jgi:hypothetical protein
MREKRPGIILVQVFLLKNIKKFHCKVYDYMILRD